LGGIAPIVLGAAGLLSQNEANRKAQSGADAARRSQDRLLDRQVQWYDDLLNIARRAEKDGQFDPEKQIAQLEADTARYESRDMGNTAGALRTAGYRPGDSELGRQLEAVKLKYRQNLDSMRAGMRRQALFDMIGAYSAANPGVLNAGIASAGQQQQLAMGQQTNPAGLFGALMPFLERKGPVGTPPFNPNAGTTSAGNSVFGIDFSANASPSKVLGMKWPTLGGY